jgi:hypothetical protein
MKPYGIPRILDVEFPDIADIHRFGLKSSIGHFSEKGGEFKSYIRNCHSKASTRRYWKRKARQISKCLIQKAIKDETM